MNKFCDLEIPAHMTCVNEYDSDFAKENRKDFLETKSPYDEKMLLYNGSTKNELEKIKEALEEKKTPINECCSHADYFWTALHYACYHGHVEVVEYLMNFENDDSEYIQKRNTQCSKGKTPLMYALTSCKDIDARIKILDLFLDNNCIVYSLCDETNKSVYDKIKSDDKVCKHFLTKMKDEFVS